MANGTVGWPFEGYRNRKPRGVGAEIWPQDSRQAARSRRGQTGKLSPAGRGPLPADSGDHHGLLRPPPSQERFTHGRSFPKPRPTRPRQEYISLPEPVATGSRPAAIRRILTPQPTCSQAGRTGESLGCQLLAQFSNYHGRFWHVAYTAFNLIPVSERRRRQLRPRQRYPSRPTTASGAGQIDVAAILCSRYHEHYLV